MSNDVVMARTMVATMSVEDIYSDIANVELLVRAFKDQSENVEVIERNLKDPTVVQHNILNGAIVLPSNQTTLLDMKAANERADRAVEAFDKIVESISMLRQGVRYCSPGEVTQLQKEKVRAVYQMGDCILVWVNEGDFFMFQMVKNMVDRVVEKYSDLL